jgi:hypothetical protein
MKTKLVWLALPLAALACSAPKPASPDAAMIGVRVTIQDAFGLLKVNAEEVYFARVDESGALSQDFPIPSNYAVDGYAYLINAQPGTYAAVAAATSSEQTGAPFQNAAATPGPHDLDELTYLPEIAVSHTVIRVEPGTAAFMGDYVLERTPSFDAADATQMHYHQQLQPEEANGGLVGLLLADKVGYCGTLSAEDRGPTALGHFIDRAGRWLGDDGWSSALAHPVQPSLR